MRTFIFENTQYAVEPDLTMIPCDGCAFEFDRTACRAVTPVWDCSFDDTIAVPLEEDDDYL